MAESLSIIVLDSSFTIGIESIDQEHGYLIAIYNNLVSGIESAQGFAVLDQTTEKLFSYADYHFVSEEMVMTAAGYPGLAQHRKQHASFIATLEEQLADRSQGHATLRIKLAKFVGRWIQEHILASDRAFGAWFRTAQLGASPPGASPPAG
ncbi:MAG: hemerythrin family protein [Rhodospirillaceae bacterium]